MCANITDMKSANPVINPAKMREERDKALAIEYIRAGGGVKVAADMAERYEINARLIYRAVKQWRAWAEAEVAKEAA